MLKPNKSDQITANLSDEGAPVVASFLKNPNNNQKLDQAFQKSNLPPVRQKQHQQKAKSASEYYENLKTELNTLEVEGKTAQENKTKPNHKKPLFPLLPSKKNQAAALEKPLSNNASAQTIENKNQPKKPFKKPEPNKFTPNKFVPNKPVQNKPVQNKPAPNKFVPNGFVPNKFVPNKAVSNKAVSDKSVPDKSVQSDLNKPIVRIIPLGGLNEIGKNMTVYECMGDMFIVDCGLAFPDADMLGVDLVIPDFTYIEKNISKIKGLCITHGHEDHIGSIPYLLKKFDIPIYASPLAIGLIKGKLKEHGLLNSAKLHTVTPRQTVKMGCMTVEFLRVNHSIPDAMACAIHTPAGVIVQTGDFKIDFSPIEGEVIDLARFAELGSEGVLCLLSDSTNAERAGSTMSERKVGQSFQNLFNNAEGKRIIIASFASNIHRIQQIITLAHKFGRKVAVSGRSMENVVAVAIELGYLTVPEGLLMDIDAIGRLPREQTIIITTGSQGEPMSALSRMAMGEHRKVNVTTEDFIIISATPIPGNEKHVTRVVNDLLKIGAEVVYEAMYEVHVSGHACQDELKTMLAITKPKYFMPVHGEFKHMKAHSKLALEMGVEAANIHIGEIGQVIAFTPQGMKIEGTVEAGRVLVDGLGVGDVGAIVLRDRKHLAQDGLIIVVMTMENSTGALLAGPDIVSRGFVYVREAEELISEAKTVVKNILVTCSQENIRDWATIKLNVRDGLSNYIYKKTKRGPMILPIITEV